MTEPDNPALSARLFDAAAHLATSRVLVAGPAVIDALEQLLRDLGGAAAEHEHDLPVPDEPRTGTDRYCNDELLAGALADALLEERDTRS